MKRFTLILILVVSAMLQSWAAKSYEMEVYNLVQLNETEFNFDVRMRNTTPAEPFAIEVIQWQFSFNAFMLNGGSLNNGYLTYVPGTTDLVGAAIIPQSGNFSTAAGVVQWVTDALGEGAQTTVFNDGNWKRIGTFKIQLRNSDNTAFQNFADVAHNLAFIPGGVIVNSCNYTGTDPYYRSGASFEQITNKTLTNSLSTRDLAGFFYTGTGDWNTAANWNNITAINTHTLPGATNNAIIAGSATVTDAHTVKQLTVATGGYMVLNQAAQLTTTNLYNDNALGGGYGVATVVGWNFENLSKTSLPYTADDGIALNNGVAVLSTTAVNFDAFYDFSQHSIPGWTRAPFYYTWATGFGGSSKKEWRITFSTSGYSNLKLSSKQWSDITNALNNDLGPDQFKLQWSLDGSLWTDIGSPYSVGNDGSIGNLTNVTLPSNIDNQSTVYIRWINNTTKLGESGIEDINIAGETIPTGILIQSTASGTGSLIQSTPGVLATVGRYIGAWTSSDKGWHLLSSPVSDQAIVPAFTDGTLANYDFYKWNEPTNIWLNQKVSGNNITAFVPGTGYLVAYAADGTKTFTGTLNVADISIAGLTHSSGLNQGWNLLGNPFTSALKWNDGNWVLSAEITATAKVWNDATGAYSDKGANGIIPAMNGFMVETSANGGSLTIPMAARVHDAQAFYKSGEPSVILIAHDTQNQTAQESIIRVNANATDGFDREYDSHFLAGCAPQFYSIQGDEKLSTNTMPDPESHAIAMGFVKNKATEFSIELKENLPEATVFLQDHKTDLIQNLNENPVYSFTSAEGDDPNRFVLYFLDPTNVKPGLISGIKVYASNKIVYINQADAQKGIITVYNTTGQVLRKLQLQASASQEVSLRNFAPGVYVVALQTGKGIYNQKVVVK